MDQNFKRPSPPAKAIRLGGVAIGNINAIEHDMPPASIKTSGCILSPSETAPRIGKVILAVAVLDVNSVKKFQ